MRNLFLSIIASLYSIAAFRKMPIASSTADTVQVCAYILSVHDINFHEKEYTVRFWPWFLHNNAEFDLSKPSTSHR